MTKTNATRGEVEKAVDAIEALRDAESRGDGVAEHEAIETIRGLSPAARDEAGRITGYSVEFVER